MSAASHGPGKTAYEAACQRGRAITTEEGVAFAVEDKQPPKTVPAAKPRSHALLTHRQLDVARHVADGLTNKLGLNSRTQISRWMADLNEPGLTTAEERP